MICLRAMTRLSPTLLYLAALSLLTLTGFAFPLLSPGLAMNGGDGPLYCRDLLSSGGEDDDMIAAFRLFALPLLLRLLWLRRPAGAVELAAFALAAVVSLIALRLAGLDCAQIFYTAFVTPDPLLAAALAALPLSALLLLRLRAE